MNSVKDLFSKLRSILEDIISDCRKKVTDIEIEENFIKILGDFVEYCESDILLLPFYDEEILVKIFERIFPLSSTELNKIKVAKYLIEASNSVDKSHFSQYNDSVKNVNDIYDVICKFYKDLSSNEKLESDKNGFVSKIDDYTKIFDMIGEDSFVSFIDDIDLFENVLNSCDLSLDEINIILNVAIRDNLSFLDLNGVKVQDVDDDIKNMKIQNDDFKNEINSLNNLLG